jgi:hypothetical protein
MDLITSFQELTTPQEREEVILLLEEMSLAGIEDGSRESIDTALEEVFCNGIYSRQITLKKGTTAVGEIHKQEHLNILSSGSVLVFTSKGMKQLDAPHRWVGEAGVKRATFALTDTTWTTIHATTNTSSEAVRKEFVAETFDDVPRIEE